LGLSLPLCNNTPGRKVTSCRETRQGSEPATDLQVAVYLAREARRQGTHPPTDGSRTRVDGTWRRDTVSRLPNQATMLRDSLTGHRYLSGATAQNAASSMCTGRNMWYNMSGTRNCATGWEARVCHGDSLRRYETQSFAVTTT